MEKRKGGFATFTLDDYDITPSGEIINKRWGCRVVKPQPNGKGYLRVHIAGRFYFVHRLVAEKYIPNPDNLPQVNHKDGNKHNNSVENLEWVSNKRNREHAISHGLQTCGEKCSWAKLTREQVDFIRSHPEMMRKELAQMFNVSPSNVSSIRLGRSWKN